MRLYIVDAYADRTKPKFAGYLVRSSSLKAAEAAVEAFLDSVDKVVAEIADNQTLEPDLPPDTPLWVGDHEAKFIG